MTEGMVTVIGRDKRTGKEWRVGEYSESAAKVMVAEWNQRKGKSTYRIEPKEGA